MLREETGNPRASLPRVFFSRTAALGALAVVVALIALQVFASSTGFVGPLQSLASDIVGRPKSATVPWAGLVLAVIGLQMRDRLWAIGIAVIIDVVASGIRLLVGSTIAPGQGPTLVLIGLAIVAATVWSGQRRTDALRSVALGALLVVATKAGDTWLHLTTAASPQVLDQYAQLADRALASPSWQFGSLLSQVGPVVPAVLHWVYIELPVAAIVVAVYQLRARPWPSHHIVRTFLLIGLIGPVIYLLFPVVGPMFAYGSAGDGYQVGNFWPTVAPMDPTPSPMSFGDEAPRNCMPSLHTAWALTVFLHSRRGPLWLRLGGAFWLIGTLTATLGFGYHYGVDLIAGAVLCLTLDAVLRDPERGWDRARIRLVASGTVTLAALLLSYRFLSVQMAHGPEVFGPLLIAALAGMSFGYYATFFADPSSPLGQWGGQRAGGQESDGELSESRRSPTR